MDEWDEWLKEKCQEYDMDYSLASELKAKLLPLFEEALRKNPYFSKELNEQKKEWGKSFGNIRMASELILFKIKPKLELEPKDISLLFLYHYLVMVESIYTSMIDFVIFTLVNLHHDLYVPKKNRYAKSFDDIQSIDLAMKLKFLSDHGLNIISSKCDRKLRNSVAHASFLISEDGTIYVDKRKIDKNLAYENIRNASFSIHQIIILCLEKFLRKHNSLDIDRTQN